MKRVNSIFKVLRGYIPNDEYYQGVLLEAYRCSSWNMGVLYVSFIIGLLFSLVLVLSALGYGSDLVLKFLDYLPITYTPVVRYSAYLILFLAFFISEVVVVNAIFSKDLPKEVIDRLNNVFRENYEKIYNRYTYLLNSGKDLFLVDGKKKVKSIDCYDTNKNIENFSISVEKYYLIKPSGIPIEMIDCIVKYNKEIIETINLSGNVEGYILVD